MEERSVEDDLIVGSAVEQLLNDGDDQAASLLLDVLALNTQYLDTGFSLTSDEQFDFFRVTLIVPRWLTERFTDEVCDRILNAMYQPAMSEGMVMRELRVESPLAEPGWRARAEERLGQGPSNQATIAPSPRKWSSEDRLRFRDPSELRVYRALKRAQAKAPKGDSISILPNPGVRTAAGSTWEPDFFIAYRGRCGVIEVDGPTHHGRAAADKSRDRLLEDSGVSYVDRWVVEETTDDDALDDLVERFLRKLGG